MKGTKKSLQVVLLLAASNLLGPFAILVSTPILTRLYPPEEFGLFFFFFNLSSILALLLSGTFFHSIYGERSVRRARFVLVQSSAFAAGWAVIGILCVFGLVSAGFISKSNEIEWYLTIILSLSVAVGQSLGALVIRLGRIKLTVSAALVKAALLIFLQWSLPHVLNSATRMELLVSAVTAEGVACLLLLGRQAGSLAIYCRSSYRRQFRELRQKKSFLFHVMPSQLLGVGANFLPFWALQNLGASVVSGHYGMAFRLFAAPINAVAQGLRSVLWRILQARSADLVTIGKRIFIVGISFNLLVAFSLYFFEPRIMSYILGPKWTEVDSYLAFASLWMLASFLQVFPSEILKNIGGQASLLRAELCSAVIKIVMIGGLWLTRDAVLLAKGSFVAGFLSATISYLLQMKSVERLAK
ncbi:MAG: hypothetical protein QM766_28215 [Burkholderiaceae bacterium]